MFHSSFKKCHFPFHHLCAQAKNIFTPSVLFAIWVFFSFANTASYCRYWDFTGRAPWCTSEHWNQYCYIGSMLLARLVMHETATYFKKEKWVYSVNMWSILHVEIFKSINLWHQDHCGHRVGDAFNFSPRSACKEILLMWCLLYVYHSSLSGCNRVTFQAMLCSVEVKF